MLVLHYILNMIMNFRTFVEKKDTENYVDGMKRQLSIDPNSLPDVHSGPIEIEDEGLWYNSAIWKIKKPINPSDKFVRIIFHKSLSPNADQAVWRKREDGEWIPYEGNPSGRVHMVTMDKFSKILGQGWESAVQAAQAGGGQVGF